MADYEYHYDFKLIDKENGIEKKLSDFGGIVYNPNKDSINKNLLPDPEHITSKSNGIDGERYIRTVYGVRFIDVPVYFSEDLGAGELFELNQWLGKKKQQIFQWVDDEENKEIDVVYKEGFDMEVQYGEKFNGLVTLTFIAHNPYWRLIKEKPLIYKDMLENDIISFKNKGNSECFPLIKFVPKEGMPSVKLMWNNLKIELKNLDKEIYLDCKSEKCYEIIDDKKVLALNKCKTDDYFTFPNIQCGKNKIGILEGGLEGIYINMRTRII